MPLSGTEGVVPAGDDIPLTLLWVELTTDSTAAGAHLRGTLDRLSDPRFRPRVITRWTDGPGWMPRAGRKAWRIASVVSRARLARPRGVLIARWSPFIALVSRRWTRRGRPFVLFVQGNLDDMYDSNPWTRKATWITRLALASIREATHVVTPSEGLAEWVGAVRDDGRASITVIPNGVDLSLFEQERRAVDAETAADPGARHALFFGNMAGWQGIDTILDAIADPEWPADLGLRVIGEGQMAEAVQSCGDARVVYLGRLPKRDVAREVARAELTLATRHDVAASATGVSPFKIIESAASGTPCIVTRVPGQTELALDLGGSLLIPADDAHELARAVARLHGDAALRASLAADARAGVASYDWKARADALTGIILRLAGEARAASPDRRGATA